MGPALCSPGGGQAWSGGSGAATGTRQPAEGDMSLALCCHYWLTPSRCQWSQTCCGSKYCLVRTVTAIPPCLLSGMPKHLDKFSRGY
eukprot:1692423-Rhodomonas_salina.1